MNEEYAPFIFMSRGNLPAVEKKVTLSWQEWVPELRKRLKLDQEGLARRLEMDQGTISKWETGKTVPGPYASSLLAELADDEMRRMQPAKSRRASAGLHLAAQSWDRDLLILVIKTVDAKMKEKKRKLAPDKYAELIALMYEYCQAVREEPVDKVADRLLAVA